MLLRWPDARKLWYDLQPARISAGIFHFDIAGIDAASGPTYHCDMHRDLICRYIVALLWR